MTEEQSNETGEPYSDKQPAQPPGRSRRFNDGVRVCNGDERPPPPLEWLVAKNKSPSPFEATNNQILLEPPYVMSRGHILQPVCPSRPPPPPPTDAASSKVDSHGVDSNSRARLPEIMFTHMCIDDCPGCSLARDRSTSTYGRSIHGPESNTKVNSGDQKTDPNQYGKEARKKMTPRRPPDPPSSGLRHFSDDDDDEMRVCIFGDNRRRPLKKGDVTGEAGIDEHSPLLLPQVTEDVDDPPRFAAVLSPGNSETWVEGDDSIQESKSSWYLFLLTLSIGGLQIAWSVELSNGSPYLLSLGINKSLLALVWIAGPLSGTLVQPYVGIKSDRCRSRFGKRRPFMVGGALATIFSLMLLAWTREIVGGIFYSFGVPQDSDAVASAAIVFAILLIYVLDFSINVIQAAIRAFIVDNAPTHQQDSANAWASRLTGVGSIIGYLFGYVNLPRYLWFFGDSQFKVLCFVASTALATTLLISCITIKERDPRLEGDPVEQKSGVLAFFNHLRHAVRRLPPQIRKICIVQCWAWLGWFPFLFYTTTYIAEIYVDPLFQANPKMTPEEIDKVWEKGTRIGTFALLMFALVTFMTSVLLPFVVAKTYQPPCPAPQTPMTPGVTAPTTPALDSSGASYFTYNPTSASVKPVFLPGNPVSRLLARPLSVEITWFTLRRAWMFSHLVFALLTWSTFLISTTRSATILVALIGIPWAVTNWAPFALIAAEVSKRDAIRRGREQPNIGDRDGELLARGEDISDGADQAGTVLGIHNVAIAAPQVIATLASSAIFHALQKPRGAVGDESVAWVLRFGGCAALVAAWYTRRVGK